MTRNEKIEIIKRLVARGEKLCAEVCAYDWNLLDEYRKIVNVK